jgi:hypothetical protein
MVAMKSSRGGCMKKTHSLTDRSFHPGSPRRALTVQIESAHTDRWATTDSETDKQAAQPTSSAGSYSAYRKTAKVESS